VRLVELVGYYSTKRLLHYFHHVLAQEVEIEVKVKTDVAAPEP